MVRLESSVAPRILTLSESWMSVPATLQDFRPEKILVFFGFHFGCIKAAFHYSSKLQTWLQTWSQTCVSVSQAGRKHVESRSNASCKLASNKIDVSGHEETETLHMG